MRIWDNEKDGIIRLQGTQLLQRLAIHPFHQLVRTQFKGITQSQRLPRWDRILRQNNQLDLFSAEAKTTQLQISMLRICSEMRLLKFQKVISLLALNRPKTAMSKCFIGIREICRINTPIINRIHTVTSSNSDIVIILRNKWFKFKPRTQLKTDSKTEYKVMVSGRILELRTSFSLLTII